MSSRRLARYALLTALAMALSWLESLVPLAGVVPPGVKLGLTNLVVIFALYRMSLRDAAVISLIRVVLVAFTFGNSYSFAYSLAGAALSLAVMALLKRSGKFSLLGVSVAGGVSHNIAQVLVAMAVLETARLAWYLPVLLVSGIAAGVCVGAAGALIVKRIRL
ncbi:MAG TPA: Gx transporter family protein [Candidatus Pelethomonas intestinigallinarum]|nr:Gx transporter family protein [Candidatus Pelethomonas intestinigallinarum]